MNSVTVQGPSQSGRGLSYSGSRVCARAMMERYYLDSAGPGVCTGPALASHLGALGALCCPAHLPNRLSTLRISTSSCAVVILLATNSRRSTHRPTFPIELSISTAQFLTSVRALLSRASRRTAISNLATEEEPHDHEQPFAVSDDRLELSRSRPVHHQVVFFSTSAP
jgi:hypothetical protein